jgi:hypothetical protein
MGPVRISIHHKLTEGGDYVYACDSRVHRYSQVTGNRKEPNNFLFADHPAGNVAARIQIPNAVISMVVEPNHP